MGGNKMVIHEFEWLYFEKLRLAAQVILDAAPDLEFVTDPLAVELGFFKDRVEHMLLLPPATQAKPQGKAGLA